MKSQRATIQTNAAEQYFPMVLFIILYEVVLTFEYGDEILKWNHSNESYWAILSFGAVYYTVRSGSNFWVWGRNPKMEPFKRKLLSNTFLWCCLLYCTRWFYFWVYGWNSNESYWTLPLRRCGLLCRKRWLQNLTLVKILQNPSKGPSMQNKLPLSSWDLLLREVLPLSSATPPKESSSVWVFHSTQSNKKNKPSNIKI